MNGLLHLGGRRRLAALVSISFHIAIIAALIWLWTQPSPPKRQSVVKVFAVAGVTEKPVRTQTVQIKTVPLQNAIPISIDPEAAAFSAGSDTGPVCQIALDLQVALAVDQSSRDELAALPPAAVSVANAIVLWAPPPELSPAGGGPFARPAIESMKSNTLWQTLPQVSALVLKTLSTQSPECLDADQTGPDFLFLSLDGTSMSMAVGSGRWRWHLLLDDLNYGMKPQA